MHPIGEARREQLSVSADYVRCDAHLGDGLLRAELVGQTGTGVQRDRLPDSGDPRFQDPKVVQDAAQEYQLVVIVHITLQALGRGEFAAEQVTTHAVMRDKCRRDAEYELLCRAS